MAHLQRKFNAQNQNFSAITEKLSGFKQRNGYIVSLRSVNDPENDYPSKLYEHNRGEETYSVFVTIKEGDTLILPFPYTLTISGGVMFK